MVPTQILVPTDFSETAEHGVAYAFKLAQTLGAKVHLVHVFVLPVPPESAGLAASMFSDAEEAAEERLEGTVAKYQDLPSFGTSRVTTGDPVTAIIDAAKAVSADMIVIGTHGRRGVQRMLLGSVAESVLRAAPCPVLAIRLPGSDTTG